VDEPIRRRLSPDEFRKLYLSLRELLTALRQRSRLLLPLYAAMGIGSIVDYAILTWTPALLSRRFAFTPAEIGAALGGVAILAGVIGTPVGGLLADWSAARFGLLSRIRLCGGILVVGLIAAPVGVLASSGATMASVFIWILVSSMAGTIGIATILDLLPSDLRGFGTATIAFFNTIIGLGLGPTLVALATDRLYGTPSAVGLALTTVSAPAILVACLLFYAAAVAARREEIAIGCGG
jgi:MFS family permease